MQPRYVVIALALSACKSNAPDASHQGSAASSASGSAVVASSHRLSLPQVSSGDAVATLRGPTPLLMFVDDSGKMAFGLGPNWDALTTYDPTGKTTAIEDREDARKSLMDARLQHMTPTQYVAFVHGEDTATPVAIDDKPAADGDDHQALALSEGKMGKGPTQPRTEHDNNINTAGGFGSFGGPRSAGWGDAQLRQASVAGEVVEKLAPTQPAVVLAHPRAKASAVVAAVMMSEGLIGVSHADAVAALRIQFLDARGVHPDENWAEVHLGTKLEFTATKGPPAAIADSGALEAAYKVAHLDPYRVVDVLVAPDVDAQQLVDVLVALEHAGARAIGLGDLPSPPTR